MPLRVLDCSKTRVTDFSPLKDLPIRNLYCDFTPARDAALPRSIKTLEVLNGKSSLVMLQNTAGFPPLDPAWVKKLQSLPPRNRSRKSPPS